MSVARNVPAPAVCRRPVKNVPFDLRCTNQCASLAEGIPCVCVARTLIPSRPHSGAGVVVLTCRTVAVKSPAVVYAPVSFHRKTPASELPQKSAPPPVIAIEPLLCVKAPVPAAFPYSSKVVNRDHAGPTPIRPRPTAIKAPRGTKRWGFMFFGDYSNKKNNWNALTKHLRQERSPLIDTRLQRDFIIIQKKLNIRQCQLSIWREKWSSLRTLRDFKFTGSGKLF